MKKFRVDSFTSQMLFRIFKPIPIIIFAIVLGFSGGYAQSNISGVVIDSLSQEPVPFANIFFANTLIGTATDVNGEFHIRNIPDGKYDFVIYCVGYKTFRVSGKNTSIRIRKGELHHVINTQRLIYLANI